jgi:hypothetical protein
MPRFSVLVLCAFTTLAGCGLSQVQKDAISQFSQTSSAFGKNVSNQLTDARDAVIDARKRVLILNPSKLQNRDDLEGTLTPKNVSARVRAAEALQSYGELLEAIVEDTQKQELEDASKTFTTSLRGLDPDSNKLSDDQLTAIGGVVQDIGGLFVEYKKEKALKELIPATHDQVKTVAELFKQEFKTDGPFALYVNGTSALLVSSTDPLLDHPQGTVADRTMVAESFAQGIQLRQKTNEIYPQIAAAADTLISSHQNLINTIQNDKLEMKDLTAFTKTVQDIVTKTKIIAHK